MESIWYRQGVPKDTRTAMHPASSLALARRDLDDATTAFGSVWAADDRAAIGHLTNATEALTRALASLVLVLERQDVQS
jgi:hypothetical protein